MKTERYFFEPLKHLKEVLKEMIFLSKNEEKRIFIIFNQVTIEVEASHIIKIKDAEKLAEEKYEEYNKKRKIKQKEKRRREKKEKFRVLKEMED